MDFKSETEKVKKSLETEAEPGEELNDVQWLKIKYGNVLDREIAMSDYLIRILENFEYRINVLEKKMGEG